MEKLKDFFRDKNIKSILDVGTGTGDFVAVIKESIPDAGMVGIDPSTESLLVAKERFPEVSFLEMGAEELKFENNSFDLASISMALHHVPDVQKSLKEMQRVVKQGGWIVINELFSDKLNPAQETHKMYHHFRSKIDRLSGVSHNETFKKEEIIEMVKKSGINVVLHFENDFSIKVEDVSELEERVEKMKTMLEKIKHLPEYEQLMPEIKRFQGKIFNSGIQSPPRVVIVGEVNK